MTITRLTVRLQRTPYAVLLITAGLCACGGGGESDIPASTVTPMEPAQTVSTMVDMEGCVVDHYFVPRNGNVRALLADGRLVASGRTNSDGVFVLRVPAQTTLKLELEAPDPETTVLLSGRSNFFVAACLIDTRD